MAARLAIGIGARERQRHLAVVFAVDLRMKIVVELYMREMSAPGFYEKFGGGSRARISQNFNRLAKKGWLRLVRTEGPGGKRHGAVEHFYRATELPFMDAESWALLPYSVRVTSSWNMFRQILPRLRQGMEAQTTQSFPRRDLSCTALSLDEEGWRQVISALDARFMGLYDEQEDAYRRSLLSGERLVRADAFLIAFQSPDAWTQSTVGDLLLCDAREPLLSFPERLAPILEDDLYLEIVSGLNERELSVTQFHREFGGASKGSVSRRFSKLDASAWIAKGQRKTGGPRRGASEQFYRATRPDLHSYDPCADAPSGLKGTEGWNAFELLCASLREAMIAGTFDSRPDRYFAWSMLSLDRQGWESVIAGIESLHRLIFEEQKRAKLRMDKSGEKPIAMTVGLGAFGAMKETIKAP